MPDWLINALTASGMLVLSLTVTLLFNKLVGMPKEYKRQKAAAEEERKKREQADKERDNKIAVLQTAIDALPSYRAQSVQIQQQLQSADNKILDALTDIKDSMLKTREILNERLDRLEDREKNSIRAKLLDEFRLFTDERKNPMLAWSEMEHHAFFKLVKDYEGLNGNDYVHSDVLPAVNKLAVIPMSDKETLLELMQSRRL
jgi:seryl-tRNA synthetase